MWSVDRESLRTIERKLGAEAKLELRYKSDQAVEWTASRDGKDLTTLLDPAQTNFMLGVLEGLKVTRWLSPDDESAASALADPSLTFTVIEEGTDDADRFSGLVARAMILAPATSGANPGFYNGRLNSDMNPFLLDRETYNKLATELMEK